ncbi:hypothetical protein BV898_15365 [Hypsibius exemplaris]|uniref:Uncharacterized protein n=1 Tax=Hypsibius exemplaris TaxID=2072580 RepID=A0A9X6NAU1_HYPEX|nr:hypothetical protein BV898_15365 [Hypsibius exemplaris]
MVSIVYSRNANNQVSPASPVQDSVTSRIHFQPGRGPGVVIYCSRPEILPQSCPTTPAVTFGFLLFIRTAQLLSAFLSMVLLATDYFSSCLLSVVVAWTVLHLAQCLRVDLHNSVLTISGEQTGFLDGQDSSTVKLTNILFSLLLFIAGTLVAVAASNTSYGYSGVYSQPASTFLFFDAAFFAGSALSALRKGRNDVVKDKVTGCDIV